MKETTRYITFSLGEAEYAVPLLSVREVIAVPETTPIPFTPGYFMGLMNLRGQVISIIDLRKKFGLKSEHTSENVVIICDLDGINLGVVVDKVNSVISPSKDQLSQLPTLDDHKQAHISEVLRSGEHLILVIDVAKTLNLADRKIIEQAAKTPRAA